MCGKGPDFRCQTRQYSVDDWSTSSACIHRRIGLKFSGCLPGGKGHYLQCMIIALPTRNPPSCTGSHIPRGLMLRAWSDNSVVLWTRWTLSGEEGIGECLLRGWFVIGMVSCIFFPALLARQLMFALISGHTADVAVALYHPMQWFLWGDFSK
jgi:hypothetical protein